MVSALKNQGRAGDYKTLSSSLDEIQSHRIKVAIQLVAVVCMLTGFGWMMFFIAAEQWFVVWLDVLLAAIGLVAYFLVCSSRMRIAAFLLFSGLFCVLVVMSAFLDVPGTGVSGRGVPRVVHLYFLALAFLAYLILQNERGWVRFGVIIIYLAAFVAFSTGNFILPLSGTGFDMALSEDIRAVGAWVNGAPCLVGGGPDHRCHRACLRRDLGQGHHSGNDAGIGQRSLGPETPSGLAPRNDAQRMISKRFAAGYPRRHFSTKSRR